MDIVKNIKEYFTKKRESKKQYFKQDCVFAHSELEGDMRVFKMQSGRVLLCKLAKIENPYSRYSIDDTAQRDLIWEVVSELDLVINEEVKTYTIKNNEHFVEIPFEQRELTDEGNFWSKVSLEWIKKYYPTQNAGIRFLRGT